MSNTPLFPNEEKTSSNLGQTKEEKPSFKQPECILIDDRNGNNQYTYFGEGEKRSLKGPLSLRLMCFLSLIFCFVFGLGVFLWSITLTCFATLSLFQDQRLNREMRSFWKIVIHTIVAGFSFILGFISPTLGLGLLALYFSLATDLVEENLLRRVIRRSFNHF